MMMFMNHDGDESWIMMMMMMMMFMRNHDVDES